MSFLWGLKSGTEGEPSVSCPSCASTLVEQTPFRSDCEIVCRCHQCLTVFRAPIAVQGEENS